MSPHRDEPTLPPTRLRVLLATDGAADTTDAALAAWRLARRGDERLHVVAAQGAHAPTAIGKEGQWRPQDTLGDDDAATLARHVRETLSAQLGDPSTWDLTVRDGAPASVIADVAADSNASLIVMGRGQSRTTPHMLGEALALQVARLTNVPILAVCPGRGAAAHTAVVAVDFSAASIVAARTALQALDPGAPGLRRLVLLHGLQHGTPHGDDLDPHTLHQFARLESMLASDVDGEVRLERRVLHGDVATAIRAAATEEAADIIALGTHGRGFLERLFVGSVAITTLREADTSVLIAPAPPLAERIALELELWEQVALTHPEDWGEALRVFTRRNTGRPCRLEQTESVSGEVHASRNAEQFVAAEWDAEERSIILRFREAGEGGGVRRHPLLRVVSIELMGRRGPGDHALLVEDAGGHCVLTLLP